MGLWVRKDTTQWFHHSLLLVTSVKLPACHLLNLQAARDTGREAVSDPGPRAEEDGPPKGAQWLLDGGR